MLAFRRQGGGGHARKPPKDEVIQFFRAALVLASRGQASYSVSSGARLGFLAALGAGIVTAVALLAGLLHHLLAEHPVLLWSFFFGLVAASVPLMLREIPRSDRGAAAGIALLAGGLMGASAGSSSRLFQGALLPPNTPVAPSRSLALEQSRSSLRTYTSALRRCRHQDGAIRTEKVAFGFRNAGAPL